MYRSLFYPATFISFLFFHSCTVPKTVYSPPTANLLRPDAKGNAGVAVNYSTTAPLFPSKTVTSGGIDLQTTYGISNKIALRADLYYKKESDKRDNPDSLYILDYKNKYQRQGFDISAGFYRLGNKKSTVSFQLFAGIGLGKFKLEQTIYRADDVYYSATPGSYYHNMSYFKGFVQPSLVVKPGDLIALSFATRLSLISFSHIKTDLLFLEREPLGSVSQKSSFFSDFIFQTDFGFPKLRGIRFQGQTGITKLNTTFKSSDPSTEYFSDAKYKYNRFWLALGVVADVNKLFSKK